MEDLEIRRLQLTDLPAALRLVERQQWNQTEDDWRRMLGLSPEGCFAAVWDGGVVGTVTTTTYGKELAWIGMMLVAEECRGRGIGKRLMETALEYCRGGGIATVMLDATPAGRGLYESLGFVAEGEFERWEGAGFAERTAEAGAAWDEDLRAGIYALDDQAFYVPRREVLDALMADCWCGPAVEMDDRGRLRGYGLVRRGARASYVGPLVAVDRSVAIRLMDSLAGRLAGRVFVDIRVGRVDLVDWLKENGFAKQRDLTRMTLGRPTRELGDMVFAIAGPELG